MLAYLLIIAIAFLAVAVTLVQLVGEYLFSQQIAEDGKIAAELSDAAADALYLRDANRLYALAADASDGDSRRVLVLDAWGVVQADASSELNGMRFAVQEVHRVLQGENSAFGYYAEGGSDGPEQMMALLGRREATGVFASAIKRGEGTIGVLVYISRAQQIYDNLMQIQQRIVLWMILVTLAVLVMSMFVLRRITVPIAELNEGIQLMTRGDFTARVNVPGKNEFAQLGKAFNTMSERLEKLDQARNQFVSNASHELKTPLATMKIMLQSVQQGGDAMPLNKEVFSLKDMVQDQVKRLLPMARERGIEMDCVARDAADVEGDLSKLSQVVYNVIDNAIKYTPRGGSVNVELTRSGKRAVIRVSDTGIGIPEADIAHIFDRFYRVDKARSRETGGTGLGLSIVKQIVNLHDGDITVTSVENQGSTFVIDLPLANK